MLDVALLTANASQLKYVLQVGEEHPFYELMLSLIIISIILQVAQGIILLVIGPLNISKTLNPGALAALNHTAMAFSFGIMFIDTIKMVFGQDLGFENTKPEK